MPWCDRVYVIAEAGVNHNGDVELAKQLIDGAHRANADAVKFQTWKPGEITGRFAYKVDYQKKTTSDSESRYELSTRLALPYDAFRELSAYAKHVGITFLSTPDGFESLDFLVDELNIPIIKIGSTEVTHIRFLEAVGAKRRPVVFSTGLSSLGEVEAGIDAVRRGGAPSIVVLHCTSEYPAPIPDVNLRAMSTIATAYQIPVGYSDHTVGREAAIAAVALGACVIEKHFTLDKHMAGPDHAASADVGELTEYIQNIRSTEILLGDGIKRMTLTEARNREGIRRSVIAARKLTSGTVIGPDMLGCKRPGYGIAPEFESILIGMRLTTDIEEDQPLEWKHFK